jgi:Tfp pilus assembly protein PilF
MQTAAFSEMNEGEKVNVETIKLMAGCHCKLKNYKKAHEYIQRALDFSRSEEGEKSKEVAKLKIESGKIFYEEKNYSFAIN